MTVISPAASGDSALSSEEIEMAKVARRLIGESLDRATSVQLDVFSHDESLPPIQVPAAALRLFGDVLAALSERKSVAILSNKQELTTLEAATLLDVSRPFLIKEIERGKLECRMVGTHRRIFLEDLMRYKAEMQSNQDEALEELAKLSRELGLDY